MGEFSDAEESVLTVLCQEDGRMAIPHLAYSCDLEEQACLDALRTLSERGLTLCREPRTETNDEGAAALTDDGREVAHGLAVVAAEGRVPAFASGLDELQLAVVDAVTEQHMRFAGGGAVMRRTIRASVRSAQPNIDIQTATAAIESLSPVYLQSSGGAEPLYQVTLRGLLASRWGSNALQIVQQILDLLEELLKASPSVQQYSWRSLRERAHLPHKAMNLAYDTVKLVGLGTGFFTHSGERWWSVPSDLDVLLECGAALEYVRSLVESKQTQSGALATEATAMPSSASIFISHASDDADLAKKLIELIEAGLETPTGTIRCTSVDGYKLEGGDNAPEVLRDNLKGCAVVLGILTRASVSSSYVLMELGAAWAFKKRAVPLIGPGATFGDLPGPFKDVHALRMAYEPDMAGLIGTIAKETRLQETHNLPKIQTALKALVSALAASPTALGASTKDPIPIGAVASVPGPIGVAPALVPPAMADDKAMILLEKWLAKIAKPVQSGSGDNQPILQPEEVARQAGIPEAKVALLPGVALSAPHLGVTVKQLSSGEYHLHIAY